jgi:hypothetical protein
MSVRDSIEVAIEAVRYLKTSDRELRGNTAFHRAAGSEVIASGQMFQTASDTGIVARIQRDSAKTNAFRLGTGAWHCSQARDTYAIARCALSTHSFYVHVLEFVMHGDKLYVSLTAFVKDRQAVGGMRTWGQPLVEFARTGGGWKAARVLMAGS